MYAEVCDDQTINQHSSHTTTQTNHHANPNLYKLAALASLAGLAGLALIRRPPPTTTTSTSTTTTTPWICDCCRRLKLYCQNAKDFILLSILENGGCEPYTQSGYPGGEITRFWAPSTAACAAACMGNTLCQSVEWFQVNGVCILYDSFGSKVLSYGESIWCGYCGMCRKCS